MLDIVMPVYIKTVETKKSIRSILDCTESDFMLHVYVNKGSDQVREMVESFKNEKNIKITFLEDKPGKGRIINQFLRTIKVSDYVCALDDDVEVCQGWDTLLIEALKLFPEMGWVTCWRKEWPEEEFGNEMYGQNKALKPPLKQYFEKRGNITLFSSPGSFQGLLTFTTPEKMAKINGWPEWAYGSIDTMFHMATKKAGFKTGFVVNLRCDHLEIEHSEEYDRYSDWKHSLPHLKTHEGRVVRKEGY